MSNPSLQDFADVRAYFGLPSPALVEKDFHVARAIQALAALDAAPFKLVFGGGTALARAHKLLRRMSEDVDFKIVPLPSAPVSRSALHRERSALRDRITAALLAAGFAFDPRDKAQTWSRDESRYTVYHLPYAAAKAGQGLRPSILVELNHTTLRRRPVLLPVASFVAEAMKLPPEVAELACVDINETAAEKLVSITRRTAMERTEPGRPVDETLVRHIYDLHMMRTHITVETVVSLARDIARADAQEFRNQHPAYADDMEGETRKALAAFQTDPVYRRRYESFLTDFVYGDAVVFDDALQTVLDLATQLISA